MWRVIVGTWIAAAVGLAVAGVGLWRARGSVRQCREGKCAVWCCGAAEDRCCCLSVDGRCKCEPAPPPSEEYDG